MSNFRNDEEKLELAKSLDMTVDELDELLKSVEEDEDISKAKEEEEEEVPQKEAGDEEEQEQEEEDEDEDVEKSLKSDIASKVAKLREIQKSKNIEGSDEIMKSFGEMKEDIMKSISDFREDVSSVKSENEELKKSIGDMQETLNKIAENSQGTKGMRVNMDSVLNKSVDVEEEDGKKYYSSKDKRGLLKAMENIMGESADEDLVKSISDDIIQLESTGQITRGALHRLNDKGIYVKEQRQ